MNGHGVRGILSTIRRRRAIVFGSLALGLAGAFGVNLLSSPRYRAEATVKITLGEKRVSLFGDLPSVPSSVDPVQSQIEIIRSRTIARSAVTGLGLNIKVKAGNPRVIVRGACSADAVKPGSYRLDLQGDSAFLSDEAGAPISSCTRGDTLRGPDFCLVLDWKEGDQHGIRVVASDPDRAADGLRRQYSVFQKGRTDLVRITCTSGDPGLATETANALAQAYVDYTLFTVREQARATRQFIENQMAQLKAELTAAEDSLRSFKETEGVFELSESATNLIGRLSQLDGALASASADASIYSRRVEALEKQLADTSGFFGQYRTLASNPDLAGNPQLAALSQRLNELAEKKAGLLADLSPSHPEVIACEKEMEKLRSDMARVAGQSLGSGPGATDPLLQDIYTQLVQSQVNLESSLAEKRAISALIAEREDILKTLPGKEQRLAELVRRVEADRKVYDVLVEKLQEARIEEARQVSDARVVDPARAPLSPVSPRKLANLALGLLLGLLVGMGTVFGVEHLNDAVRESGDLEGIEKGAILLGAVPLAGEDDEDILRDAIYAVSMNLLHHCGESRRVFLVTSPEPEAGKSFVASGCAMALAEMGRKVLLVDADMRKPRQHRIFGLEERGEGLSDILHGRRNPEEVGRKIGENISLITAGSQLGLAASALASGAFGRFLDGLSPDYDVVIVDAPPIAMGAIDTLEMVSAAPWTVMVIKQNSTPTRLAADSIRQLKARGGRLIGFVLNFFDPSGASYDYYYYHYGGRKARRKNPARRALYWLGFTRR